MSKPILEVNGLSKRFGGLQALKDVSFEVEKNSITCIIGPNGAGKSTLFNLITGVYVPDEGNISLHGQPITRVKPFEMARLGVGRSFQTPQTFGNMSVLENVISTVDRVKPGQLIKDLVTLKEAKSRETEALEALKRVHSEPLAHYPAGTLSFGQHRHLELARILMLQPSLVLLDEPASGLSKQEVQSLKSLLREFKDNGLTIMMIEHDMDTVMEIADHIVVLNFGQKIAEGKPQEIQTNKKVTEAYLGVQTNRVKQPVEVEADAPIHLKVENLSVNRGNIPVLHNVNFEVRKGEFVGLLGANGAGKSTLLGSIMGMFPTHEGKILLNGQEIQQVPLEKKVKLRMNLVPERRQLFNDLTVEENLYLGYYSHMSPLQKAFLPKREKDRLLESVFEHFPRLKTLAKRPAGTLSGGEQQMVAIGRGLMTEPEIILLDEPSLGLAPLIVEEIFKTLKDLAHNGTTVVVVEQQVPSVFYMASRFKVLSKGTITFSSESHKVPDMDVLHKYYLGA